MIKSGLKVISRKLDRIAGAVKLCMFHAADMKSRRTLLRVYASLSDHDLYDDEVFLTFRVGKRAFPFHMRISDIFIVLEILHEQQYRLRHPIPPPRKTEPVPVITLADYLETRKIARVDLLKIDIEGAEQMAIDGFGPRIECVQTIIGEVHDTMIDAERFYDRLRKAGFSRIIRNTFREGDDLRVHGFEAARA